MKHPWLAGLAGLSCMAALTATAPARAMMIAPAPIAQRVAQSEVIIVGKVTGFADKTVSATQFPGATDKAEFQVAIVKVNEALLGAKDMKEIKVGFVPPAATPPPGPPGGPFIIRKRYPQFQLTIDQEAILFLNPHGDAPFYVGQAYYDVIGKKDNPNFEKDLDEVKRCAKLLADPTASLKSKSADDRYLTAAMLVSRYKMARPSATPPKTEDIDAEQSKLILQALADADWAPKPVIGGPGGFQMQPQGTFAQLGVTEKEGFKPPADFKDYPEAAKKWLKDNADKYRIQRFVAAEKKDDTKEDNK